MDSIDPSAYLTSLMAQPSAAPAKGDLDSAILALAAKQSQAKAGSAKSAGGIPLTGPNSAASGGDTLTVAGFNTGVRMPQGLTRFLAGAGQGLTDIARHAGNLVGLESNQDLARAKQLDAPLLNTGAGQAGNIAGTTAALAPFGMGTGAALGRLGTAVPWLARLARPVASGAIQGAAQGALTADPGSRLQDAAGGGIAGAALPALGGAISKLAGGLARSPAAQTLLNRGLSLTPGQLLPSGAVNRVEQALTAIPVLGAKVAKARAVPGTQYTRAMIEDAMAPGAKLTSASTDVNDLVDEAAKSFDPAYQVAQGYPMSPSIVRVKGGNVPLTKALQDVVQKPRIGLTAADRSSWAQQLTDQLQETIKAAKASGGMQSDHLLAFRSAIRDAIRNENGDTNASRAAQGLLKDAEGKVTEALESQLPGAASQALRDTDAQFAKFAVVRSAAKAAKDQPAGPTGAQFSTAVAQATPPNVYARGGGYNRDLTKAARETLQSTVPHTGLTGAGTIAPLLHGALGVTGAYELGKGDHSTLGGTLLGLGALGLGGSALYSEPALRAFAGQTGVQRVLAGQLGRLTAGLSPQARRLIALYGRSGLNALEQRQLSAGQPATSEAQ